jgi:hypothetical protein
MQVLVVGERREDAARFALDGHVRAPAETVRFQRARPSNGVFSARTPHASL